MRVCFETMTSDRKLSFILTGMNSEFYDIMKCIANFVYALYKERKRMYDIFSD